MDGWDDFARAAPRIAGVFTRRHTATKNLCFLGTLRTDGSPRVSPMEPLFFDGRLWLIGMPDTRKFADLRRDPRYTLHTATIDTQVGDGDAKVWGAVREETDRDLYARFTEDLFARNGFDLRGEPFDHFFEARVAGAAAVEIVDGILEITTWQAGGDERVTRKH